MAGTLTINGTAFASFATSMSGGGAGPAQANYYAVPPFGNPPQETARAYQEVKIQYVGVPEIGTKRMIPFGGKRIRAELILCGTKSQCESAFTTISASFEQQARFTIALPSGASYNGFKLVPGSGRKTKQEQMGGVVMQYCEFEFEQLGANN